MYSYFGHCRTQLDCLVLFEAVKQGRVPKRRMRFTSAERENIQSGAIYIWDEKETGIRRWTDGRSWSTSRVLSDFLVYRELDKVKRLGSTGNCRIKPHGLCKLTSNDGALQDSKLHLVGYYSSQNSACETLMQPSRDMQFQDIVAVLEQRLRASSAQSWHCTFGKPQLRDHTNAQGCEQGFAPYTITPVISSHFNVGLQNYESSKQISAQPSDESITRHWNYTELQKHSVSALQQVPSPRAPNSTMKIMPYSGLATPPHEVTPSPLIDNCTAPLPKASRPVDPQNAIATQGQVLSQQIAKEFLVNQSCRPAPRQDCGSAEDQRVLKLLNQTLSI